MQLTPPHLLLLKILEASLADVNGEVIVIRELAKESLSAEHVYVLATGKAAPAMAMGAYQSLGSKIQSALVISKDEHCVHLDEKTGFTCLEAGHPVPDERSLQAGHQVIQFLQQIPEAATLLVLTSGGTSALVEALPDAMTLNDLVKLNEWLLRSGIEIQIMNTIRQSVSLIKGGRLRSYISVAEIRHLIISDVPGDDPSAIGSGMLVEPVTRSAIETTSLPEWLITLQQAVNQSVSEASTKQINNKTIEHRVIANNQMACESAAAKARENKLPAFIHKEISGNAEQQGKRIAQFLLEEAEEGVHIWGGETTMILPSQPGRGGRNQHLALIAAQVLAGSNNVSLMAVGTDGTDGPTQDAGAIVDGSTIRKGTELGLDSRYYIKNADAGSYLEETGSLINTGITGTNVMDLVIAIKTSEASILT
ncbi:MAG: DUF4147 domain-containing protein [Gammaproteobacteria bacterium]|nr:DUF4147 domain-containing protein [Gammaproteobacteria bacterium]